MSDLGLLKQYEPILRFTEGELFFPMAVAPYVARCSLWERLPDGKAQLLVPIGELTLEELAHYAEIKPGHTLFLQFVQKPLQGLAYQRWLRRTERPRFRSGGRLARVGLLSRLVDSMMELSLLLRGKVPKGTIAAGEEDYREILTLTPNPYAYYGRVVREGGYIVLHYLYFYAMNSWRSNFYGVNDHEADWEQVLVYLEDHGEKPPVPAWVAYAAHDYSGDDLRRRWDDPQFAKEDTHPVIFVGAGSHASYFEQGEYLMQVELGFLKPVRRGLQNLQRFWNSVLRQSSLASEERMIDLFSLPYIDYARGDGLVIGAGQGAEWQAILISDADGWVDHYRGLWGLDTKDPMKGETAPAGPKYNRDGTVRQAWHNPLGWAGMNKVVPRPEMSQTLQVEIVSLQQELDALNRTIAEQRTLLTEEQLKVQALQRSESFLGLWRKQSVALEEAEARINLLYQQRLNTSENLKAARRLLEDLKRGDYGDPQAHLKRVHHPYKENDLRESRLIDMWAAFSAGLLLVGFGFLILIDRGNWVMGTVFMLGAFAMIEAALRNRLHLLLLNITLLLAIVTTGVLVYEFFWEVLFIFILLVSRMIIVGNFRELRGQ